MLSVVRVMFEALVLVVALPNKAPVNVLAVKLEVLGLYKRAVVVLSINSALIKFAVFENGIK